VSNYIGICFSISHVIVYSWVVGRRASLLPSRLDFAASPCLGYTLLEALHVAAGGARDRWWAVGYLESGVEKVIDVSLKGIRCKAAQEIFDLAGTIGVATEGTIVYELDGEGGQLVNVQWDDGTTSLVSSEEIVITDGDIVWQ